MWVTILSVQAHTTHVTTYLRHSLLVGPQLKARLGLGRLARGVPNQDERGGALLASGHAGLVRVHRQARDSLGQGRGQAVAVENDVNRASSTNKRLGSFSGSPCRRCPDNVVGVFPRFGPTRGGG